jgi:hypothetical protein
VDCDFVDAAGVLESGCPRRMAIGALSRMGEFCRCVECEHLVVELRDLILRNFEENAYHSGTVSRGEG